MELSLIVSFAKEIDVLYTTFAIIFFLNGLIIYKIIITWIRYTYYGILHIVGIIIACGEKKWMNGSITEMLCANILIVWQVRC